MQPKPYTQNANFNRINDKNRIKVNQTLEALPVELQTLGLSAQSRHTKGVIAFTFYFERILLIPILI